MARRTAASPTDQGLDRIRGAALDFASAVALGLGVLFLPLPLLLLWFIHGDNERYEWLISGPPPFDQLGSGPVQLALVLGSWTLAGSLLAIGLAVRRRIARGTWTPATVLFLALGIPATGLAVLALAALLAG